MPVGALTYGSVAADSGNPLSKKLGIGDDSRLAIVSAPAGFDRTLGKLPRGVHVRRQARGHVDVLVFFVTRRAELSRRFDTMARAVDPDGGLWIAWPKRTSGVATDLTEHAARDIGLDAGLVDNKVCRIDDTWSGLRFVYRVGDRPSPNGP